MNFLKKRAVIRKAEKTSKELDIMLDKGLVLIMTKCKVLIDEGKGPDDQLKQMVKVAGEMIAEKEKTDLKFNEIRNKKK